MDDTRDSLSFSTMWNYMKSPDGAELLRQIMELGFRRVELNYRITREMLDAMAPLIGKGLIEVSSVHNVFPRIDAKAFDTDSLLLGYPDPGLRRRAVELTKGSVDYAHRLGAGAVVIHPGAVPLDGIRDYDAELKRMVRAGEKDTPQYRRLFGEMKEYRERESPHYLRRIRESLAEVGEYIQAKKYRVSLGLENRAMCHQIPDLREATVLLDELRGLPVGFWYDIGHSLALEALGLFNGLAEIAPLKERIIGVHIHDTVHLEDHWAPYIQSDNLDPYLEIIKAAPVKVLELGAKNTADEIKRGVDMLCEKLA